MASLCLFSASASFPLHPGGLFNIKYIILFLTKKDSNKLMLESAKYPAKFGIHRPYERGDITSLSFPVTKWSMCHMTLWVVFPHPKSLTSKFGVHRPCESGDITFFICHVSTRSKSHGTLLVGSTHPKSPSC